MAYLATSLQVEILVTKKKKKHLDKFFKIFILSVLAIGPSDLLAITQSRKSRVLRK